MHVSKFQLGLTLSAASLAVSVAVGSLAYSWNDRISTNQSGLEQEQAASQCWDEVLVVALHDHLTPAQRMALVHQGEKCSAITR